MPNCYCGNSIPFQDCCEPYIKGITNAPTAEKLMRSRYSAFATGAADYLVILVNHIQINILEHHIE